MKDEMMMLADTVNEDIAFIESLELRKKDIAKLLPDGKIDRFIKSTAIAISENPDLSNCTRKSLFLATVAAAELGLDFCKAKGWAYLVPYKGEAKFMPGYRGFIELITRPGKIIKVEAEVVYEADDFSMGKGTNPHIKHIPNIKGNSGEFVGAYAVATFFNSMKQFEFIPADEVGKIRMKCKTENIWSEWPGEMRRKTAVRRLAKYLPMNDMAPQIVDALAYDNDVAGVTDDSPSQESLNEKMERVIVESHKEESEPEREPDQSGEIFSICKKRYMLNQEQALELVSVIVQHSVDSMTELTQKEASWVLENLGHTETIKAHLEEIG